VTDQRPLVLGASGQVGTAFVNLFDECRPATRKELDLAVATRDEVRVFLSDANPSVVINCAAYTSVDRAEDEEELATRVNGDAVGWLAEAAKSLSAPFLSFSTDYVFDGAGDKPYLESHPTDPINAYGRSKESGERAALAVGGQALVVRTSWVLSATHRNFVTAILLRASDGHVLTVVNDQVGCPTMADDLARASWSALEAGALGLLHLTNQGETTWFDLARASLEKAELDGSLVTPCTTEEYPTPARRPAYSVLGSEVAGSLGLDSMPPWQESLDEVVTGSMALIAAGA
jgi:dTDP-4-dehydrorhamnose reductase